MPIGTAIFAATTAFQLVKEGCALYKEVKGVAGNVKQTYRTTGIPVRFNLNNNFKETACGSRQIHYRWSSMSDHQLTTETGIAMITKTAPPVTVSLATVAGYQVSELVLWATLIYTILMIAHKLHSMYKDIKG